MTTRRTWATAVGAVAIAALGATTGLAAATTGAGGAPAPEGTTETTTTVATTTTSSTSSTATATAPTSAPLKTSGAPKLTVAQAVGQMLITHVDGLTASPALLKRVRTGQVGSVILYSENISTTSQLQALTASLQRAAREGHNPPLFIGTDQEGGPVKRLADAAPWLSAAEMGATSRVRSVAEAEGRAAGRALLEDGVNLDFAPVADVPTTSNNFLGERAFGDSTSVVEDGVTGFATGLAEAHVAGSVKHFPGLGGAGPRDTDTEVVTITLSKAQLRAGWAPYRAVARLHASVGPFVMISNAIYPALSRSGLPADLTPSIVRNELASTGLGNRVTVTDDLQVPAVERYPNAAVKAVRAGIDLLMYAQEEAASERAYRELVSAVHAGSLKTAEIMVAADRVVELKDQLLK